MSQRFVGSRYCGRCLDGRWIGPVSDRNRVLAARQSVAPLEEKRGSWRLAKETLVSYRNGGAEGSRTPDLLIANETLYQLSYDPAPILSVIMAHPVRGAS